MMRNRFARACVLASLFSLVPLSAASEANAQGKKPAAGKKAGKKAGAKGKGKGKKGDPKAPKEVVLEDDDAGANDEPAVAGQPTEEAATAKRLFDKRSWMAAAGALHRVVKGETGDDKGNQQIAQFQLAVALYNMKYYSAAYAEFSKIADKPNHLRFNETLLWLAKLATQLPEPADIVERLGKYSAEQLNRFNKKNATQKKIYWQLNYLLGQRRYRNQSFPEAVSLFQKVSKKSDYYVKSQFFNGISYVRLRKAVPAVKSFQRVVKAIDNGAVSGPDTNRLRDLAFLSMARTFYSASIQLDSNNNPTVNGKKLSAAVKYWNLVDTGSEYWLDALFEESWAYFMAGDYPRALGNIHTIKSPFFPHAFYPESDILRAQIFYATCQYDDATTVVARFKKKFEPVQKDLQKHMDGFAKKGQEKQAWEFFKKVHFKKAKLSPATKDIVEGALSDRQLLRNLEYLRVLNDEAKRYKAARKHFKNQNLYMDVGDALDISNDLAVKKAGALVRQRYQRMLDELNEHLRDAAKIMIDISAAERTKLEASAESGKFTKEDAKVFGVVKPDNEHVLWPFDGEFWRDELGFYRQVVVSKCGR